MGSGGGRGDIENRRLQSTERGPAIPAIQSSHIKCQTWEWSHLGFASHHHAEQKWAVPTEPCPNYRTGNE